MMEVALVALVGVNCPPHLATILFHLISRAQKDPIIFFFGIGLVILVNIVLSLVDRLRHKR
jgi:hypothetical protein